MVDSPSSSWIIGSRPELSKCEQGVITVNRQDQCESPISSDQFPHLFVDEEEDDNGIDNVGVDNDYFKGPSSPKRFQQQPVLEEELSNRKNNDENLALCSVEQRRINVDVDKIIKIEKPFFVMDFLEHIDPEDLELARYLLTSNSCSSTSPSSPRLLDSTRTIAARKLRKDLFAATSKTRTMDQQPTIPSTQSSTKLLTSRSQPAEQEQHALSNSIFFKRSVAIGNKFNARGINCATRGDWKKALACWEDALEVRSQVLGECLDVANTCNNIGIALGKLNRYEEAITSLQRSLDIRIGQYGWDHEVVAATLHNMGNVYQQSFDLRSAIECFRQSEAIHEHLHGRDHPEVARSLVAMGHTYNQGEAIFDARQAYFDALTIFERVGFEVDHPEVQSIIEDLKQLDVLLVQQG